MAVLSVLEHRDVDCAAPQQLPLPLIGGPMDVPLLGGETAPYADLDCAASTRASVAVWGRVSDAAASYASVHRGAGYLSQLSTAAYEQARSTIGECVGARADDEVVITRGTTDSVNLLARALPPGSTVVCFDSEHHANLLPWEQHDLRRLPVPAAPGDAAPAVGAALADTRGPALVAVTAASNVTGERWPVQEIVAAAHACGARVFVDVAQLVPHCAVSLSAWDADWVAFSGHKLFAPFGAGALVGRADWLDDAAPYLAGGGAVEHVGAGPARWATGPQRHEGGSPNVLGAVALAAACSQLHALDQDERAAYETRLATLLDLRLAQVPGLTVHTIWSGAVEQVGVRTFTLDGWAPADLAVFLSDRYGIGVRHGKFCAHPLVRHLLGENSDGCSDGAVRVSVGLSTSFGDIDRLGAALLDAFRSL